MGRDRVGNGALIQSRWARHWFGHHQRKNRRVQRCARSTIPLNLKCEKCPKAHAFRTVVVKDTMPPIITLHYKDPKMMAETAQTSSVNMWAIAAAASAITGLAILAVGNKKSVTSVPV